MLVHILFERDPVNELHDDVLYIVGMAYVIYADNVGMTQLCDGPGLGLEALAEFLILSQLGSHDLNRNESVQPVVHGFENHGHSSAADPLDQLIAVLQNDPAVLIDMFVIHKAPPWAGKTQINS